MEVTVTEQTVCFLLCILGGLIIGIFFDVFRIIRKLRSSGVVATFIMDILFWIITTFFVFIYAIRINNGNIRFYMFCGILIGGLFYDLTLSRIFVKIMVNIIKIVKNIFGFLIKILLFPIKLILKIFKKPIFIVIRFSKSKIIKVIDKIKFNILWFKKLSKKKKQPKN